MAKFKVGQTIIWESYYTGVHTVVIKKVTKISYYYERIDHEKNYNSSGSISYLDNIARLITKLEKAMK